jgi:type IV secretion system protein TrbL
MPSPGVSAALGQGVVLAFPVGDLNPLKWLGSGASKLASDVWQSAMTALWSAGLWVLGLAFKIIDAFTTPDLSTSGPLADVLPYTFAIGGFVAGLMALIQIGMALYRRDGQSVARVMVGAVQFGAVWIGYVALAAVLVEAAAGLTTGLLQGLLHINNFASFASSASWPRRIDDTVVATVLGLCTVFIVFPAAIGYILIMLVREAALLLLTATSPIAAAGLLAEGTRVWFWKSLRWFLATLLIAPLAAVILGIGVQVTRGTIAGHGDKTAAAVGMAVTGCILILIGAICPLILFRLLAFVDPGTSSGAAMRQAFTAHGGLAGMLGGKAGFSGGDTSGSGAATRHDGGGRSQGEATADAQTGGRFSSMFASGGRLLGEGMQATGAIGTKAAAIGSDVLGSAGVGHQAPYFGHENIGGGAAPGGRRNGSGASGGAAAPGTDPNGDPSPGGWPPGGGSPYGGDPPTPPTPSPPTPPTTPTPGGGGGPPGGDGGAAGGGEGAASVPVVPA